MIGNAFFTGVIAILIGYLLGSIPSAYIFTRLTTGKDIRKLGGGNVGGLNTLREVGRGPAIATLLIDVVKGTAVVAITHWGLQVDPLYVYLAAGAAIVGHNWMVWLKFSGGRGMGVSVGALLVLMPAYGYAVGLWILLGLIVVPLAITRNVALSMGLGLIALPFIAWLSGPHSGMFVTWSIVMGLIIAAKFASTAISVAAQSTSVRDFIRGH